MELVKAEHTDRETSPMKFGKALQIAQLVSVPARYVLVHAECWQAVADRAAGAPGCSVLWRAGLLRSVVTGSLWGEGGERGQACQPLSALSVPRGIHAIAGRWEGQGGAGRVRHHTTAAQHSAPIHPRACFCLIYLLQAIGDDEEELGGYVTTEEFLRLRDTSTCGKMQVSSTHKL